MTQMVQELLRFYAGRIFDKGCTPPGGGGGEGIPYETDGDARRKF